jgi:hypothetical protein
MSVFDDIRQAFDALAAIANPSAAVLQAAANLVTVARELDVAVNADARGSRHRLGSGGPRNRGLQAGVAARQTLILLFCPRRQSFGTVEG